MTTLKSALRSTQNARSCCVATVVALSSFTASAYAGTLPTIVSNPVGSALQSTGGLVTAVGKVHASVAPTVTSTAPALEPTADGVTNGIKTVGNGLTVSGQNIQSGGLAVNPLGGARQGLQTLSNGSLVQARVGSLTIGRGASSPVIGVGALTNAPPQGTLATAGVANANALLNANAAPQ